MQNRPYWRVHQTVSLDGSVASPTDPQRSKTYALPAKGYPVKRYGQAGTSALDHGTAHAAVMSGPFQVLIA
jgi:hypothetical protein